jgi:hypothetical protein
MNSAKAEWDEQIEIGVGAITLNLARAVVAFTDVEPEARTALRAVRGAEVGVYHRRDSRRKLDRAAMLRAADKAMEARGWDRVVGVIEQHAFVAVYVPNDLRSTRNVKACVVSLDDRELVVASARSNLEPLMELAFNHG